MSTFMLTSKNIKYTSVSNLFIDKYLPNARGEYVKVYLLGLKYCQSGEIGASSDIISSTLNLLETDVLNAWHYWEGENVINLVPLDSKGNYRIEFLELSETAKTTRTEKNNNLVNQLNNPSMKGMFEEIEQLIGRPLSSKEMHMYLNWQTDYNFSPELILLLIQYSASKGKTDYRYIEKIAIAWHDAKIKTISDAQTFIKHHEDKWVNMKKILNYLGMNTQEIAKPTQQILDKWINVYKFPIEIIYKACDICFERLNKAEFKYIDAILNSWFRDGVKTLQDIEKLKKKKVLNPKASTKSKGSFGDFEQRSYDFNELEKKLLGWDNND